MTIAIQTLQPMQCSASVQSALLNKSLQNKIPVASRSMPIVCILANTTDTSISICHSWLSFSRILLVSSLCLRQESQQRNYKRSVSFKKKSLCWILLQYSDFHSQTVPQSSRELVEIPEYWCYVFSAIYPPIRLLCSAPAAYPDILSAWIM